MKKKLLFYEKNNFGDFKAEVANFADGGIYPISYLLNESTALKYTGIENVEKFVIDITAMVLMAKSREDLRLFHECWISALNDKNGDNVFYCIEKNYINDACEIFSHYFEADMERNNEYTTKAENFSFVEYDKEKFDDFIIEFNKALYGHGVFKADLEEKLKAFILLHKMKKKKVFSLLLCGKSGIGKTEVGRVLQKTIYPEETPIKINFGNYSGKGSLWSLIGSPKGYIGSEQGGELTNKIARSNSKIIIIDELDKADEAIYTFFYEMLEDGQYTDLDGKVVDLDGYIVVFTANLDNGNFKDKIPEPLFSRFDMTYEFEPLSELDIHKFASDYIDELVRDYSTYIGDIKDTVLLKTELMKNSYTKRKNLRNIRRDIMNDFVKHVGVQDIWK